MVSEVAYCSALMHIGLITDKNVNWMELRKLRMTLGCGGGRHAFWHPTVQYSIFLSFFEVRLPHIYMYDVEHTVQYGTIQTVRDDLQMLR